jgi:hypothetical protein
VQELQGIAVEVAKEYKLADGTEDPEFKRLAHELRLPYWDWAYWDTEDGTAPLIPDIIVQEKWEVRHLKCMIHGIRPNCL